MFCIVLGLIPAEIEVANQIRITVAQVEGIKVQWRSSYSLANDADKDDAETLLMTAIIEEPATPDAILASAQEIATSLEVEVWASAPGLLPLRPREGYERHIVCVPPTINHNNDNDSKSMNDWSKQASLTMKQFGLLVQPRILEENIVHALKQMVNEAIENVEQLLATHRPSLHVGHDTFLFQEIASRNQQRFDLRLPTTSQAGALFRQLLDNNTHLQSFLRQSMNLPSSSNNNNNHSIWGEIDFDLSVVYSRPGAEAQGWHADGQHVPGALDAGWDEHGWQTQLEHPYAICLFLPLIDLDETVGYTQFWPASHTSRHLVGFGSVAKLTNSVWNSRYCRAGDGVWYDYRLLHQGMPNVSASTTRPIVQVIFKKHWYVERANYGTESILAAGDGEDKKE